MNGDFLSLQWLAVDPGAMKEKLDMLGSGLGGGPSLLDRAEEGVVGVGTILLLAVSIIAFLWVTYSAVAKFRECQAGRADWSELLVLGVAAGALLVFVTILLSNAGGLLGPDDSF